jgi:alcohol dehydrogenase YqhD (iron-dependent ADH family)
MENFQFCIGTRVLFGKEQINNLPEVVGSYGKKVLLAYGGGNIKRTGLYDTIKKLLADYEVFELAGIQPNPRLENVYEGVKICKENNIDVILAVGGGSTIDCSKAIAAATCYDGDAWDLITSAVPITKALPLCTVLTLAATGSETNPFAIIANPKLKVKTSFASAHVVPRASILDPTYTFTVPPSQTACGSIDIFLHTFEQYCTNTSTFLSDQLCESVMRTIIKYAPITVKEPDNYEARGQLMWAGSLADNGILCGGNLLYTFSCHGIEQELSGRYNLTHGVGLAIVTPRWMRHVLGERTVDRFSHYGISVWGIDAKLDKYEIANKAIDATEDFFNSLGVPMTLTEAGIDGGDFETMAEHAVVSRKLTHAYVPLDKTDVVSIYKMCL